MAAFVARYANAFIDVITAEKLDTASIDRQFADFLATWDSSPELQQFFCNPSAAVSQKVAILDKLNAEMGLQKELRNLLAVMISNSRIDQVHEVAEAYRTELQTRQGIRQAEIVSARELDSAERDTLVAAIGKLAGSKIQPNFKLDTSILGGTVVRIGSTVYDGSIRGRLTRLKEALIAG
jgi:F-type H+-transporting ATPase subunit delta